MSTKHTFSVKGGKLKGSHEVSIPVATSAADAVRLGLVATEDDWHTLGMQQVTIKVQEACRQRKADPKKVLPPQQVADAYVYSSGRAATRIVEKPAEVSITEADEYGGLDNLVRLARAGKITLVDGDGEPVELPEESDDS